VQTDFIESESLACKPIRHEQARLPNVPEIAVEKFAAIQGFRSEKCEYLVAVHRTRQVRQTGEESEKDDWAEGSHRRLGGYQLPGSCTSYELSNWFRFRAQQIIETRYEAMAQNFDTE